MTQSEEEGIIVVATRVRDMPINAIPGSTPDGRCKLCDEVVWRSPSTRELVLRKQSVTYRCRHCVADTFTGTEEFLKLTPLQIAEIKAGMKRNTQ